MLSSRADCCLKGCCGRSILQASPAPAAVAAKLERVHKHGEDGPKRRWRPHVVKANWGSLADAPSEGASQVCKLRPCAS